MSDKILTEAEVRAEYRKYRKDDKVFAECWPDKDYEFYEWCFNISSRSLCLKRHEVSEKIGLGSLAHFMVDMKQGKLKFLKNLKFVSI